MKDHHLRYSVPEPEPGQASRWFWILMITFSFVIILILALALPRHREPRAGTEFSNSTGRQTIAPRDNARGVPSRRVSAPAVTAEEIVAGKITQFADDRLRITHAMAQHLHVDVGPDVERFFRAVREGHWEELNAAFKELKQRRESGNGEDLVPLWGPILETQLIAECGHKWPAQKLLDYGQATLGALQPGMVYVGGTDPGRGIPTLLNETGEGERHVVITQNALADASYLQYVNFLYGDRLATLTSEDSQRAFEEYMADARRRLDHDQQFPDEPKQIRPGEDIRVTDNRLEVSGQVAVMAINEKLLRMFMNKNPDLSFGLEESFPLKSTYPDAVPLGPIMQLDVQDVQNYFTRDTAAQAVDFWRDTARQYFSDDASPANSAPRLSYAKMAAAQASLLADHEFAAEAEQAYRVALQISPTSPEAVFGLGQLLAGSGRADEARRLITDFQAVRPNNEETSPDWKFSRSGDSSGATSR